MYIVLLKALEWAWGRERKGRERVSQEKERGKMKGRGGDVR